MLERLNTYFMLVHRFRHCGKPMVQKAIMDKGLPDLLATTGNPKLRGAILRFMKENGNEQSTGTTGS